MPGTSYLFGTMHVQDARIFDAAGKAFEKVRACESFAAEFHLDNAKSDAAAASLELPQGKTLSQLIPGKKYQKLRRIFLKTSGFDLDYLQKATPFAIANLVSSMILQSDMPVSLDEHLWNLAKKEGKTLQGIETLQEQVEVVGKIPLDEQIRMLLAIGKNVGRFRQQLRHAATLYQQGDVQRLFKNVKKNSKGLRKLLLYRRNEIMAERIAGAVKEKTLFAAIGVGHLGGERGVIRLLKKEGLRVRPVR